MQNILRSCAHRVVLFDNRTHDRTAEAKQVDQLLSIVNTVVNVNGGLPYTDEIFKQAKVKYILIYPKKLPVDDKLCYSQCNTVLQEMEALKQHNGNETPEIELIHEKYEDQLKQINEAVIFILFLLLNLTCYYWCTTGSDQIQEKVYCNLVYNEFFGIRCHAK